MPASKDIQQTRESLCKVQHLMKQESPISLSRVDECSFQSRKEGGSSENSLDGNNAPQLKDLTGPETVQVVSSDEEVPNSRKRRLSKRSESIEIENISKLCAPLPDVDEKVSPDDFLSKLVAAQIGLKFEPKKAMDVKDFFYESTEEEKAAYTADVLTAVRNEEIDELRKMKENGKELNCFNRFGESLLNLACRRGFKTIVRYLMDQPNVTVRISDDCGRTPLHDACWHPQPQLEICKWILEEEPALFFIKDKRGCTAFEYARPEHWPIWRKFLLDNRLYLDGLKEPAIRSMLSQGE